ncbi:substrate-binding domain-containing protein [Blautia sp. MSJ-19]|uniref:substrate-binding domain-containing protein n=1 Tax=Blautia sp. MSJ-19 TaxID=2841517 RepID=UPI001C0EAA4B|nr:substrate-binding domain-containing protein [Blautia sp. MSJ-19]MBU5481242.1 substrate-binding domain-containing protein [Blautia sp. MSJ-19]
MKKRAVCMLLGVLLMGTVFTGCGKNKATEAASESAQTEKEGTGEQTAEETGSDSSKESKADTDKKDADQTAESDDQEKNTAEEVVKEKIAVLLPDEKNWSRDAKELELQFENDGYEPQILYAENDSSRQVSQIQQMTEEAVSAMVIAPVDPYGLGDVLSTVKDAEIPVFSYESLIMDTNAVNYYVTFGGRQVGQMIGKQIIDSEELDKVQEAKESRSIEFFMGSLDDTQALFLYNGVMETLQPYLDDGTLVCRSGKLSFDDTGLLRWSTELARTRMTDILAAYYQEGEYPDIICTGFDNAAMGVEKALEENGLMPGAESWPLISGSGCNAEGVRRIAEGKQSFSIFMDRRELADKCEEMVHVYLHGEDDPEVNDYEQYDNGVKIIGTYLCEPQLIDRENYEILIDNGYYTEDEVKPAATPTPTPEPVTPTPAETVTPTPTEEAKPTETVTPTPTEEVEPTETATPTPAREAGVTATPTPKAQTTLKQSSKNK